jgi:hypothetical protein
MTWRLFLVSKRVGQQRQEIVHRFLNTVDRHVEVLTVRWS